MTPEQAKKLEDKITKMLSEWLNDNAPIGEESYRKPAQAVIKEVTDGIEEENKRLGKRITEMNKTIKDHLKILDDLKNKLSRNDINWLELK